MRATQQHRKEKPVIILIFGPLPWVEALSAFLEDEGHHTFIAVSGVEHADNKKRFVIQVGDDRGVAVLVEHLGIQMVIDTALCIPTKTASHIFTEKCEVVDADPRVPDVFREVLEQLAA